MRRLFTSILTLLCTLAVMAEGWPANYKGVMLQGFYWDSYDASKWTKLESQADELARYFSLIWIPQSGKCLESYNVMGYTPYYYFDQNSSFGTEQELRSMIATFKKKGLGTIADVVINHHNTDGWFGFPKETYKGTTYQLQPSDIVANDDGGTTTTEALKEGVSLSQNNDEGEDWSGMRDLDHKSTNVQNIVKAYEQFLLNDLGYTGFRYDMVKGFAGSHVADYNTAAGVEYSVGEYWDGNASTVKSWIANAQRKSAAFDFPFRYTVRDAINQGNWTKLAGSSLISDTDYRQLTVTFVENHDTEKRTSANQDPIKSDTLAANAFLLAMPGTPCVFFTHWIDCKQDIKAMIDVRKAAGITSGSTYTNLRSTALDFINTVSGTNGQLAVRLTSYSPIPAYDNDDFVKVLEGKHYAYYLSRNTETPWADKADGEYDKAFQVTLSAVSADKNAEVVYTTDGSTPTATNGTTVTSGTKINISADCTLKVGLLTAGTVKKVITREYTLSKFKPYTIKVYVNADEAGWDVSSGVNYWTWGGDGTHGAASGWPGDNVTATESVNGKNWFWKEYTINKDDDVVDFVFSTGSGTPQTEDVTNINKTSYILISASTDSKGHNLCNVTTTGIATVKGSATTTDSWYTLQGVKIEKPATKGIYIHNGHKVVVR